MVGRVRRVAVIFVNVCASLIHFFDALDFCSKTHIASRIYYRYYAKNIGEDIVVLRDNQIIKGTIIIIGLSND